MGKLQARDHGVRQFVNEHAFKELRALCGARGRDPDASIVNAAGPFRRLRDVTELLFRVDLLTVALHDIAHHY